MSTYPGVRWLPGGHSTFWGLLNSIVHVFMYSYYFTAALGPQYSKYVWWKQHITKIQMIQFVLIFIHEFQLFYKNECDYPMGLAYFIAANAVVFFILFANFYLKSYLYGIFCDIEYITLCFLSKKTEEISSFEQTEENKNTIYCENMTKMGKFPSRFQTST